MRFSTTTISGVWRIEPERHVDQRGFFARTWCEREFAEHGLPTQFVQCNVSYNEQRGTLRGMHYQAPPHGEGKLIRCTRGAIYDVALDIRPDSPTCGRWFAVELNERTRDMLYIPAGVAHGFQSLTDAAEVFYQMTEFHHAESARGIRWNDPAFRIEWPLPVSEISKKDFTLPDFAAIASTITAKSA
jgi:dTDP-4-dehydrorhamnose 3,5-epimerase